MTHEEYERLKSKAEEEHRKNLDAIERVFRMSQGIVEAKPTSIARDDNDHDNEEKIRGIRNGTLLPVGKGELDRAVKAEIATFPNRFTLLDVVEKLQEKSIAAKGPSVRSVMKRLEQQGVVVTVRAGVGRRPTLYEKKKTQEQNPARQSDSRE